MRLVDAVGECLGVGVASRRRRARRQRRQERQDAAEDAARAAQRQADLEAHDRHQQRPACVPKLQLGRLTTEDEPETPRRALTPRKAPASFRRETPRGSVGRPLKAGQPDDAAAGDNHEGHEQHDPNERGTKLVKAEGGAGGKRAQRKLREAADKAVADADVRPRSKQRLSRAAQQQPNTPRSQPSTPRSGPPRTPRTLAGGDVRSPRPR